MRTLLLTLFASLLLSGCSTYMDTVIKKKPDEKLIGFYINDDKNQKQNNIYVIGERNEYVFRENEAFIRFIKSDHVQNIILTNVEINTYEKIPHQVDIYYNIYLDAEKSHYSDFQQFENQNNKVIVYQPSPLKPELLEQIRHNYPNWLEENKAIRITFESKGELIKLTNRNELLEQHTLETPIKAAILHHSTRKKVNVKKSLGNAAIVPVAIIALPLLTLTCFGKQPKSFASSFVNLCPFR